MPSNSVKITIRLIVKEPEPKRGAAPGATFTGFTPPPSAPKYSYTAYRPPRASPSSSMKFIPVLFLILVVAGITFLYFGSRTGNTTTNPNTGVIGNSSAKGNQNPSTYTYHIQVFYGTPTANGTSYLATSKPYDQQFVICVAKAGVLHPEIHDVCSYLDSNGEATIEFPLKEVTVYGYTGNDPNNAWNRKGIGVSFEGASRIQCYIFGSGIYDLKCNAYH